MCALVKGGDSFLGNVVIDFNLEEKYKVEGDKPQEGMLFIDYKGRNVRGFKVNGTHIYNKNLFAQ